MIRLSDRVSLAGFRESELVKGEVKKAKRLAAEQMANRSKFLPVRVAGAVRNLANSWRSSVI